MSMAASHKRCLYEVLALPRDCTSEQIRSAYRKLALQRHPDKLVQSGLSQEEATAQFQELVKAYEVLSDLKERQWYDSHRSQILFTDPNISSKVNSSIPDLPSFCSNSVYSGFTDTHKGFYNVYSDLFSKIYVNELQYARTMGLRADLVKEVPLMGNLDSPYEQVAAFYNYWLAFSTIMDFGWVDEYDATAGPDRRTRRLIEEENNKLRKRAKKGYHDTVKRLTEFVKKRDKRVIDMKAKREKEMEIKKEKEIERRKMLQKEKMERASRYEEPEWARIQEEEEEEEQVGDDENKRHELYCVACSKRFKSDKQWKNHEQSKKHKEKVADLREFFSEEDEEEEGIEKGDQFENANNDVDELKQQFSEELKIQEDENESGDDGISNTYEEQEGEGEGEGDGDGDGEEKEEDDSVDVADSVKVTAKDYDDTKNEDDVDVYTLEAMARRKASVKKADKYEDKEESENISNKLNVDDKTDDDGFMEYDNRKKTGRNPGRRKTKGKKSGGEGNTMPNPPETAALDEEANGDGNSHVNESSSHSFETSESKDRLDDNVDKKQSKAAQVTDRKAKISKKGTVPKQENTTKGKKHRAGSKNSGNVCGNCGEEFLSRNQLHKHLGETGHASLKSR